MATVDQPLRWPLFVSPANRDESTSKDARLVNCYLEKDPEGNLQVYKRPGLLVSSTLTAGQGRGLYNWKGDVYSIVGSTLYKNGTPVAGATTLDTSNGSYRFDSCLGATPRLVMGNGVKGYCYDPSNGFVAITDVDFPAAFCKGWAYLDGTTYLIKANANIQGSGINDPTSWDPLNVIVAQIEPDGGVAMAKQLIYAIAFKQWSTEAFYDAGNATGSPLGSVPAAKSPYGCISQDSIREIDGALFWLSTNKSAAAQVCKMESLAVQVISTPAIERLLGEADFSSVYSLTLKYEGHKWYIFTLVNNNLTLAYDITTGMWAQWTDTAGNYWPMVDSTFESSTGRTLLLGETDGKIYHMDSAYYNDNGSLFNADVITPNFDAGVDRRKTLNFMRFLGDQIAGSTLQVRCSDDDYTTWGNFRSVDMSKKRPFLDRCGTFYRRALHLRHRCNTRHRMRAIDLQLDIGTL